MALNRKLKMGMVGGGPGMVKLNSLREHLTSIRENQNRWENSSI
ncbi:MAG: hypothetical protein ACYSUK_09640 [Planctomycetota bacterium]